MRGIEAARELIAHRRERLEGPAIAVARSVEDEARGKCVKVNQAVHVRAGKKMINGINIPSFLFVTGNYYLSDDGRLREIQECWPKWLAGSFPLRIMELPRQMRESSGAR